MLFLVIAGCATTKSTLPTVLTSKDVMWTIPAGTAFKAIQKPTYPKLHEFIVTDDLSVIYKGNLLELEQEANTKVVKATASAKTTGAFMGIGGSLVTLLLGWATKKVLTKKA